MVGPWISYLEVIGGADLSDIEYLAIKECDGKLRSDEGGLIILGTLADLTANTGKDMYLARAKINFIYTTTGSSGVFRSEVELRLNGSPIETARSSFSASSTSTEFATMTAEYEFKNIGQKVLAGEVISLQVTEIGTSVFIEGFIECFEEDTGTTPAIS